MSNYLKTIKNKPPLSKIEFLDPNCRLSGYNSHNLHSFLGRNQLLRSNVKINRLVIDDLEMFSVITGENGCGKTLVLKKIDDYFNSVNENKIKINNEINEEIASWDKLNREEYDVAYLDSMLLSLIHISQGIVR